MSSSDAVSTRFLVAKYIPDMRRPEPRQIGVIVWTHGKLSARFLWGAVGRRRTDTGTPRLGVQSQTRIENG